jgi:hypothetical protein
VCIYHVLGGEISNHHYYVYICGFGIFSLDLAGSGLLVHLDLPPRAELNVYLGVTALVGLVVLRTIVCK